jgi:hypothetical protein
MSYGWTGKLERLLSARACPPWAKKEAAQRQAPIDSDGGSDINSDLHYG